MGAWQMKHLRKLITSQRFWIYFVSTALFFVGLIGVIEGPIRYGIFENLREAHQEISAEFIGIGLTVLVIDTLNRSAAREREESIKAIEDKAQEYEEKRRLILQMGSPFNELAVEAARQLKARGWGFEGDKSLVGVNLSKANLQGADLRDVNLEGAYLHRANLQEADLWPANLEGATLDGANLQGVGLTKANLNEAHLSGANLAGAVLEYAMVTGARLWYANLQGAYLRRVYLHAADLRRANLHGALKVTCEQLGHAGRLEGVTLPDGTRLPGRSREEHRKRLAEPDWRTPFEEWCKTVKTDEEGYIIPASVDDEEQGE
jgi:uncharacterized protein YjbI with pentapeptide repeats